MAQRTLMSISAFIKKAIDEAFSLGGEKFTPVKEERRNKITLSVFSQLGSVVPESFLDYLETAKNPKAIVATIFARMNNNPPPYQILVEPGNLDKESVLEEFAVQTVHHIVAMIFIAPPEVSQYSPFMQDIKELHDLLRQKQAESIMDREASANGDEIGDTHIDLGPDDKTKLVAAFSRSLISIPALIKKIANPEIQIGQYL